MAASSIKLDVNSHEWVVHSVFCTLPCLLDNLTRVYVLVVARSSGGICQCTTDAPSLKHNHPQLLVVKSYLALFSFMQRFLAIVRSKCVHCMHEGTSTLRSARRPLTTSLENMFNPSHGLPFRKTREIKLCVQPVCLFFCGVLDRPRGRCFGNYQAKNLAVRQHHTDTKNQELNLCLACSFSFLRHRNTKKWIVTQLQIAHFCFKQSLYLSKENLARHHNIKLTAPDQHELRKIAASVRRCLGFVAKWLHSFLIHVL